MEHSSYPGRGQGGGPGGQVPHLLLLAGEHRQEAAGRGDGHTVRAGLYLSIMYTCIHYTICWPGHTSILEILTRTPVIIGPNVPTKNVIFFIFF